MKKRSLAILALILILALSLSSCDFINGFINQEKDEHAVYFVVGDGATSVPAQTVVEGGLIERPDDPKMDGYTFNGWYKDEAHTEKWSFDTDTVTSSVILYAGWTKNPHKCSSVCSDCGKCLNSSCTESVCSNKCEGHIPPHECGSICPDCGKCLNSSCTESVCSDKCEGHIPPHECGSICPECGLCLDLDCDEDSCLKKCEGHIPPHECGSICPECGLCLDLNCDEDSCLEKCPGHKPPHECGSICPDCGLCLDLNCAEDSCLEKCEGHNSATPTIYLAGDSTVKTYEDGQYIAGWGQFLDLFLDESVTVVNAAHGGRSSRSFINEGRLYNIDNANYSYNFSQNGGKSIEDCIKAGDFLFIQFGHNDDASKLSNYSSMYDRMVPLGEPDENGIYPTIPAVRTSTSSLPEAYTKLATDAEEANALAAIAKYGDEYYAYGSGTYKWYLKQYIDFARAHGATPVLVTPVARVKFNSAGEIIGGAGLHGENFAYVEAVRQLAAEENCLLIDLFAESKEMLETATPTYANYLMALKPNELTGAWPGGYDGAYGNTDAGYTGIEATHYNKYGAYLQAAKVAELILGSDAVMENGERFNFSDHILATPEEYIDPSNLIGKNTVASLEALFETVSVTNPDRVYPDPSEVISAIDEIVLAGDVTVDNYLEIQELCAAAREAYDKLNIDDRSAVTNLEALSEAEAAVEAVIKSLRPEPTKVVIFSADDLAQDKYTSTVTEGEFTLVATSDKAMDKKGKKVTFTYADVTYTTTYGLSLGGKASFGKNRYVTFTTEGACTITIATQSSGADSRTLLLVDESGATVGSYEAGSTVTVTSIDVDEAGTYSIGSAGSGIYVYVIIIEYYN